MSNNSNQNSKNKKIMQLRLLESTYNSKIQEYQQTFQTYLNYTSSEIKTEWEDKYPATVNNDSALIQDSLFNGDVSQDECFSSCANDDNCKYVLWSNSGEGVSCPNQCLKYTDEGGGLNLSTSDNSININNPICNQDVDYNFHGWEKQEWIIKENTTSTTLNDSTNWVNLGSQSSVDECNKKASLSELGPFSAIVYNDSNQTCYGGKIGETYQTQSSTGFTYSIPPGGQTGKINSSNMSLIKNLNTLNSELQTILQEMYTIVKDSYPKGIENQTKISLEIKKIFKKVRRLKADREKIKEMQSNVMTVDGQNEAMRLVHDANELLYLGVNVLFVGIAVIVLTQVLKKK